MIVWAAVAVLTAIGGFVLVRVGLRHSAERNREYLRLAVLLVGTFVGFTLASIGAHIHRQANVREGLLGLLEAGQYATRTALASVQPLAEQARSAADTVRLPDWYLAKSLLAESVPPASPIPMLEQLARDGELFSRLSPDFKSSLHRVMQSAQERESQSYKPDDNMSSTRFHLALWVIDLEFLAIALSLERDYLSGALSPADHQACFRDSVSAAVRKIVRHYGERGDIW